MPEGQVVQQAELPLPQAPKRFELPPDPAPEVKKAPEAPAVVAKPDQNIADPATVAEPEAKPDSEDTPEQAAKRAERRAQNKLEKAYRTRAEAKAKADFLEKQLAEERAKNAPPKAEGEPKLADFDYDPEKFAAAAADFAVKKAEKDFSEKQRTAAQQADRQRLVSAWEGKVDRAEGKYDDFESVVGELQPDSPLVAAIMEADNGEDIAYHLAKNPKEAERIAKLSQLSQVREIGKLEAKLAATPEKPKTPSKAPAPIAPLTGAAPATTTSLDDSSLSDAEWMKKRTKQVLAKRR